MLLEFITSIICELVINIEQNVFSYPITFHNCILHYFIAYPTTSPATSAWHGTTYSWRSPRSYSGSRPRSVTSARDNASTRKPFFREASIDPAHGLSAFPTPAP